MATASSIPGKRELSLITEHLNCSVCLEVYKSPRVLRCLHTFCEDCIDSVIRKNAGDWSARREIQCPVCRKGTPVPDPGKAPAEWAKDLGINYAILSLLESMSRESESESSKVCFPCSTIGEEQRAEFVCLDCKEFQCKRCSKIHTRHPATNQHKVVDIEEASELSNKPTLNLGKIEYCEVHAAKKIKFYCEDHDTLCCSTCAIVAHRPCQQVMEVKTLGQGVRENSKPEQLQKTLEKIRTKLEDATEVVEENVTSVDQQIENIQQQMKTIRDNIIKKVDQTVAQVEADCKQTKKETTTQLNEQIFRLKSQATAVSSSSTLLESALEHGSDSQLFIAYHKIQQQSRQYESVLQEEQGNISTVDLQLMPHKVLKRLLKPDEILAVVKNKQRKEDKKEVPETVKVTPITDGKLEVRPLITIEPRKIGSQPRYLDVVCLGDGRFVAADCDNKQCCLLDKSYCVTQDFQLQAGDCHLTAVGDYELAVASRNLSNIQLVKTENTSTLSKTIPCTRSPQCIACVNENELAIGWWRAGFGIIYMDGREKTYFEKETSGRKIRFEVNNFIAVSQDMSLVYHTSTDTNVVYCFGFDGKPHFTYTNEKLYKPTGVALDRDGNVYVCSWKSGTIHQLSANGQLIIVIETGMANPYTICFNPEGDQFVCINTTRGFSNDGRYKSDKMLSARFVSEK